MSETSGNATELRAIRAVLREQLARLDAIGERRAAVELNSAIELLNDELGEASSPEEIAALQARYFSN